MNDGLTEQDLEELFSVFEKYPEIKKIILFGSRATGKFKPGSDVDIALSGIGTTEASVIAAHLNENTFLPYHFDIISYDTLTHTALKEHIDRVGKPLHKP